LFQAQPLEAEIPSAFSLSSKISFTGVLEDHKSLSRDSCGYKSMKLAAKKHPDYLADFCKCSSVNWMASGLRLFRYNQGFFLNPESFSNMFAT